VAIIEPPSPDADWQRSFSKYLQLETIPDDKIETRRLARREKGYLIHNDELYHHSTSGVLQRCIPIEEGKALLLDIHEGVCGHHASSGSMVGKAFWQGFILANSRQPRGADCEVMSGMLALHEVNPRSDPGALEHPHYMVVCRVGPRPFGALQESTWGLDPPARHGRQAH
jgi:hypothetical protein